METEMISKIPVHKHLEQFTTRKGTSYAGSCCTPLIENKYVESV